jgi:hypothetical protein
LQDFAKTLLEFEFFLDNGRQQVDADSYPYLGLDGVDAGAEKRLYATDTPKPKMSFRKKRKRPVISDWPVRGYK